MAVQEVCPTGQSRGTDLEASPDAELSRGLVQGVNLEVEQNEEIPVEGTVVVKERADDDGGQDPLETWQEANGSDLVKIPPIAWLRACSAEGVPQEAGLECGSEGKNGG